MQTHLTGSRWGKSHSKDRRIQSTEVGGKKDNTVNFKVMSIRRYGVCLYVLWDSIAEFHASEISVPVPRQVLAPTLLNVFNFLTQSPTPFAIISKKIFKNSAPPLAVRLFFSSLLYRKPNSEDLTLTENQLQSDIFNFSSLFRIVLPLKKQILNLKVLLHHLCLFLVKHDLATIIHGLITSRLNHYYAVQVGLPLKMVPNTSAHPKCSSQPTVMYRLLESPEPSCNSTLILTLA